LIERLANFLIFSRLANRQTGKSVNIISLVTRNLQLVTYFYRKLKTENCLLFCILLQKQKTKNHQHLISKKTFDGKFFSDYNNSHKANILARRIFQMKEVLFKTNPQKVIEYLIQKAGKEFLSKEIQIATKMSKAGANFALNDLVKTSLVNRQQKGNAYLYTINDENPVVKQLKVLRTIIDFMPLIKKLKQKTSKIILYGSSSRGEDTEDSDIDLFIVTNLTEEVEKIMQRKKYSKKIQPIIRKPLQYIEMEKTDPTFYQEIEIGIVLWEAKDES